MSQDPYAGQSKKPYLWIAVGVGALVLLAGLGAAFLAARGDDGAVTAAEGGSGPVLSATAPDAPVLPAGEVPPPAGPEMPPEIIEWLEHLRITDEQQTQLLRGQASELQAMASVMGSTGGLTSADMVEWLSDPNSDISNPPQAEQARDYAAEAYQNWANVQAYFDSLPPPPECIAIRNAYATAIGEGGNAAVSIGWILTNFQANPQGAITELQNVSAASPRIERSREEANSLVREICRKYDVDPWFEIEGDPVSFGSFLGMPGGGF